MKNDILSIVNKNRCTSIWSNNDNMIRYLKHYIINECNVSKDNVARFSTRGFILDFSIKGNVFKQVVKEILKMKWKSLGSNDDGVYNFSKEYEE